jgi:PIN domain nuclease of toxin-antitoxin system
VIVLDTHVLIWWVTENARMSNKARAALKRELSDPNGKILVSAISVWEIAMLQLRGRLVLSMALDDWVVMVESIEHISIVPVSASVAVQATRLPGEFHKDPADRFIVALAREQNAPLLSADNKIRAYPHVRTIW